MKITKERYEGQACPFGYGIAYYDELEEVAICYPLPFNYIIVVFRHLRYLMTKIEFPIIAKKERSRYRRVYWIGVRNGHKKGAKYFSRESYQDVLDYQKELARLNNIASISDKEALELLKLENQAMKFPKDNNKLSEIFKKAKFSTISEFKGEYHVEMLTGLPSLRKINHRKVFYQFGDDVCGYNVVFANKKWGYFFLENDHLLKVVVINYDRIQNSLLSRRIRDNVRCVEEGKLYLGRFYYIIKGKPHFLGYFSLSKK